MVKGFYQLLIFLPKTTSIAIGKKGKFKLPKGYYIYTGSAKNGLKARVERHLHKEKKRYWHIDYLLDYAKVLQVFLFKDGTSDECVLAQNTLKKREAKVIVP